MTTPIDRPNRDAIIQAMDIFRDSMRPFIVRNMRGVHGNQADDLLKYSMRDSVPRQRSIPAWAGETTASDLGSR